LRRLYSSPAAIDDFAVLSIYLDVLGEDLAAISRLQVVTRLCGMATRAVDKLHYGLTVEVYRLMLGDEPSSPATIRSLIDNFVAETGGRARNYEEGMWLAEAHLHLARIEGDEAGYNEAQAAAEAALHLAAVDADRQSAYRQLADLHRMRGDFTKAAANFQMAASFSSHDGDLVLAAECLFRAGDKPVAQLLLSRVEPSTIPASYQMDYALYFPMFAIDSGNQAELERARELLLAVEFKEPVYQGEQMRALRAVQSRLSNDANSPAEPRVPLLIRVLHFISRYAELKPNVAGLGVNLNAVIDRMSRNATDAHREDGQKGAGSANGNS
jgi:tetratricopeptide (TPR) repeat protein